MYALSVCLIRMPYVYALHTCSIVSTEKEEVLPYMYALYVCLMCMPYVYALCVCLMCMPAP